MFSLLVILAVVAADQLSKFIVTTMMHQGQSIPILANVFHITYVENPGAAFGILAFRTYFFLIMAVLVLGAFVFFYRHLVNSGILMRLGLALFVGGVLGNFIDRVRLGHVIDFLDFRIWPVFNLADMAICFGVALFYWQLLKKPSGEENKTTS